MDIYEIALTDIDMKESQTHCQIRGCTDSQVVEEYENQIRLGVEFPPVEVFHDEATDKVWLVDGFHRVEAYQGAGVGKVECHIHEGTLRDAILYAVGANAKHGLRRSNDDKRRAVTTLLNDTEWSKWSSRKIAGQCGVSHDFVARLKNALSSDDSGTCTYERDGEVRTMNVSNIGKVNKDEAATSTAVLDRPDVAEHDPSPDRTETNEPAPVDSVRQNVSVQQSEGRTVIEFWKPVREQIFTFAKSLSDADRGALGAFMQDATECVQRNEI